MKKKILVLFFVGLSTISFSQKFGVMSSQEKEDFKKKAIQKIESLSMYFGEISSATSTSDKEGLIKLLLTQFAPNATLEVANRRGNRSYEIAYYLRNKLKNYNKKYAIVDIGFVSFDIKDLRTHPTELNAYILEYEFVQSFNASRQGLRDAEGLIKYDYVDETTKRGSFVIKKQNTILGSKWKMFFESVKVVSLKIL
jgi:glycerophosphoryl diester phosphodiesterase